jgi:glyoxylase-like metal-dependent hydrolase (beta-lactamase superfamily II)
MLLFDRLHMFPWQSMSANNCNTYLIDGPVRILIDPGHSDLFDHVRGGLNQIGLQLEDIGVVLTTHAHPDHLEAVARFEKLSTQTAMHTLEWQFVADMAPMMHGAPTDWMSVLAPDFLLQEGDLTVGDIQLEIIHTPGHSPGSVSIYWPDAKALFTGDVLFSGGLGRTDLPGGDGQQLKVSINRLSSLQVEWLLPGHGDIVSGGDLVGRNFEVISNTYFNFL